MTCLTLLLRQPWNEVPVLVARLREPDRMEITYCPNKGLCDKSGSFVKSEEHTKPVQRSHNCREPMARRLCTCSS